MPTRRQNHPGTAAVLSFVFTGLGQIYNGELVKGYVLVGISMAALLVVVISAVFIAYWIRGSSVIPPALLSVSFVFFLAGILAIAVSGIYSINDAYKTARGK